MSIARVLAADDEADQVAILRVYLQELPVEVVVAERTAQALRALAAEPFHAVLCDLVMPGGGAWRSCASCGARGSPPRSSS
jgi:CheY-like chemotaxis protein